MYAVHFTSTVNSPLAGALLWVSLYIEGAKVAATDQPILISRASGARDAATGYYHGLSVTIATLQRLDADDLLEVRMRANVASNTARMNSRTFYIMRIGP